MTERKFKTLPPNTKIFVVDYTPYVDEPEDSKIHELIVLPFPDGKNAICYKSGHYAGYGFCDAFLTKKEANLKLTERLTDWKNNNNIIVAEVDRILLSLKD
jgi:hypothetical protein